MLDTQGIEYDPHTEGYLLGGIFSEPSKIWGVRQIVRSTDFAVPRNSVLYDAMCAVADGGKLPTVISVTDHLLQEGQGHVASPAYAHELVDLGIYGYQVDQYAEIVRKHGERRKLAEASLRIQQIAAEGRSDSGDIIEQAAAVIDELRGGTLRKSRPIGDAWQGMIDEMREQLPYTATPWPSLNAMIGGLKPGCMYTVAGASGGGKSIFGLQLALHVAEIGGRVGYISLEMTERDLLKRLVSMMQGIHQSAMQNHQLTPEGWASVATAETAVRAMPLEIFDRSGAKWEDVTGFARSLHRKGDLKLIVVDYLGLVKSPEGSRSRSQDLENMANGAKALAKELGCAVVLLEQLNRDSVERKNTRPLITDLRGTAALEHAADAVILLYRPVKRAGGKDHETPFIEFIVAKNRQGTKGERTLYFEGHFARIRQREHEHTPLIEYAEAE